MTGPSDPGTRRPFRLQDWSIRSKLAVLLLLASVLPLAIAAVADIRSERRQEIAAAEALLSARGDQLVAELDIFNRRYLGSAKKFASLPAMPAFCESTQSADEPLALAALWALQVQSQVDPAVWGAAIIDPSGRVRIASEPRLLGLDLSQQAYFQEALAGGPVISEIHLAPAQAGQTPTVAYLQPVLGHALKPIGYLVLWVRAEVVWTLVKSSNALAGPGSFAVMFDRFGIRNAHTYDANMIFRPGGAIEPAVIEALVAERRFGERTGTLLEEVKAFPQQFDRARSAAPDGAVFRGYAPVNRRWNYGVGRRLKTVHWTVFYMLPEDPLEAKIRTLSVNRALFAGAIGLLALLLGALFARYIVDPIRSLSRATDALAGGDLSARVVTTGATDEMGRLTLRFNAMARRIESQAQALEKANDNLEAQVQERTAELLRSSESLRITLDSIGDGVIATDATGRITRLNPVAEQLTGWKRDEAFGRPLPEVFQIVNESTRQTVESPVERVLREGVVVGLANHTVLLAKDGSQRSIADSGAPIRDADGVVRGVVLVFRDMSEREKVEAALRRSEDQLRQAQKMEAVGLLAGGISHDFNNLLSVILSYTTLLIEEPALDDSTRDQLREVAHAGQRAADLTRQLLAFSRQQVLQPKVLDLNEVLAKVGRLLARVLGEDIDMIVLPGQALGKVRADPGQLEQVLMNLVVNARDAMPRGGKLTIETSNTELDEAYAKEHEGAKAGPHVVLSVSDDGIGMDVATQKRIFEPFFTTKEPGKGTGLGLATVFGIVKQSEGTIWVYSEPGRGSTFKVYFPRSELAASTSSPVERGLGLGGSETILLVEDDDQVRRVAVAVLRKSGYQVLAAPNPSEAVQICEQYAGTIDLLLTDVVMPKMSGRELAQRVAQLRPNTKVLYMSGYTNDSVIHHGVLDSEVAFIQKPLMPVALLARLRVVLDGTS